MADGTGWADDAAKWIVSLVTAGGLGAAIKPTLDFVRGRRSERREDRKLELEEVKADTSKSDALLARLEKLADFNVTQNERLVAQLTVLQAKFEASLMDAAGAKEALSGALTIAHGLLDESNRFRVIVGVARSPSLKAWEPLTLDDYDAIVKRINSRRVAEFDPRAMPVVNMDVAMGQQVPPPATGEMLNIISKLGDRS